MGNPISCYYKVPKGFNKPPMSFGKYKQHLDTNREWDNKPQFLSDEQMYQYYIDQCNEHNCCNFELKMFATMDDEVEETFQKIKKNEPDAILIG